MGSPCEILCDTPSEDQAEGAAEAAAAEAWRIEDKFSRYIDGNIVSRINEAHGNPVTVDEETAQLLDFADTLYTLSDGRFDITSGVLRRIWRFDGSDNVPEADAVAALMPLVGWTKARWQRPALTLLDGMEIDLGGIGKEYAVDRVVDLLRSAFDFPCLANFGGDLAVTGPARGNKAWRVGIDARHPAEAGRSIELRAGALATSGDARRFLERDGTRYSHVIDPLTGWPVVDAATSITVAAASCTQAGMLSTLAMLKGPGAERFLAAQGEKYWCYR